MEYLIQLDHSLLIFINKTMQNSFFDILMPLLRNKYIWIPLYVWIIAYIFSNYSMYTSSYYLLFLISSVAITDVASGQFLKKSIKRDRPCYNLEVANKIEYRAYCSSSYSFPSSHAANHFGLAIILIALFAKDNFKVKALIIGWASLISFAQIYVGIHHPLDIIGGCILGILLIKIYLMMIKPIILKIELKNRTDFALVN